MISEKSDIGRKVAHLLAVEAAKPNHQMLPIHEESGVYNFYLKVGRKGAITALDEPNTQTDKDPDKMTKKELLELVKTLGGKRQP